MPKLAWMSNKVRADESEPKDNMRKEEFIIFPSGEMHQPLLPQVVEIVQNSIYFYADVDRENILKLNKTIHELSNDILWKAQITRSSPIDIYLYINSNGGDVHDAFSAADTILSAPVRVNTIIDGAAASAATLISIAGHKRYIKQHSEFLIHQLSSAMWGKYAECQDEIQNLDAAMNMIRQFYKERTKLKMSTLNEILKHDLWFDAKTAIQYGLADEVFK